MYICMSQEHNMCVWILQTVLLNTQKCMNIFCNEHSCVDFLCVIMTHENVFTQQFHSQKIQH